MAALLIGSMWGRRWNSSNTAIADDTPKHTVQLMRIDNYLIILLNLFSN